MKKNKYTTHKNMQKMNRIEEFFGHFCQSFVVFSRCAISDSHVHILLKYRLHNHLTFAFEPLHCRFLRLGTNPTHNSNQWCTFVFFLFFSALVYFVIVGAGGIGCWYCRCHCYYWAMLSSCNLAACRLLVRVPFVDSLEIRNKEHASLDVSDVLLKWFKLFECEFHYRKHKQNVNFFVQPQQ